LLLLLISTNRWKSPEWPSTGRHCFTIVW